MARKSITTRGTAVIGIYPEDFERGHMPGRRGIVRVLCQKSEVENLSIDDRTHQLNRLYFAKEHEIRKEQLDARLKIETNQKQKKVTSFKEASSIWLEEVKATRSDKTYRSYKNTIDLYINYVGNHRFVLFDRSKNMAFLTALTKVPCHKNTGDFINPTTQNMHMRQLQVFSNWGYDREYLDKQINLTKAKVIRKDMEIYSQEDLQSLGNYLLDKVNSDTKGRETLVYKNLYRAYMLARHTLVRVGHIWALKIENIDLERGEIRFTENKDLDWKPKAMKWPIKPINNTLREFLKDDFAQRGPDDIYYLDNDKGKPWHDDKGSISKLMRKKVDHLKLPKEVKPFHGGLRGAGITFLLNKGVPPIQVQHLADHSDLATTMKYYNTRKSNQKSAADFLG
jgi:integrase